MHSRSDSLISIITAVSLLFYSIGFNIDKIVAGLISIILFIYAAELLYNSTTTKKISGFIKFNSILNNIYNKLLINNKRSLFKNKSIKYLSITVFSITALILLISTVTFTVNTQQKAIIERFGLPKKKYL